ncbi:hypothetical protein BDV95DRAFT_601403 [Massariosphaeria phaeospora]|uniref:F-box domain-containing protein n=1 Tax=Massariosphaeria phaeospora TaxID=100035 RepID=A0A7C8IL63_9PLEO|nr:hypothetical protein BDV95DRAFT_601403 [Massariosphaeria phaeospora]
MATLWKRQSGSKAAINSEAKQHAAKPSKTDSLERNSQIAKIPKTLPAALDLAVTKLHNFHAMFPTPRNTKTKSTPTPFQARVTTFLTLPPDIHVIIKSFLPPSAIITLSRVNKNARFNALYGLTSRAHRERIIAEARLHTRELYLTNELLDRDKYEPQLREHIAKYGRINTRLMDATLLSTLSGRSFVCWKCEAWVDFQHFPKHQLVQSLQRDAMARVTQRICRAELLHIHIHFGRQFTWADFEHARQLLMRYNPSVVPAQVVLHSEIVMRPGRRRPDRQLKLLRTLDPATNNCIVTALAKYTFPLALVRKSHALSLPHLRTSLHLLLRQPSMCPHIDARRLFSSSSSSSAPTPYPVHFTLPLNIYSNSVPEFILDMLNSAYLMWQAQAVDAATGRVLQRRKTVSLQCSVPACRTVVHVERVEDEGWRVWDRVWVRVERRWRVEEKPGPQWRAQVGMEDVGAAATATASL